MTVHRDPTREDARFDAAMRALHREAVAQVTPAVRWRLKPAQPAAPPRRQPHALPVGPRLAPLWAGGLAAVFALAIGIGLWRSGETPAPVAAGAQLAVAEADDDAATVLGEDPDFYAWLASDDADLVALE